MWLSIFQIKRVKDADEVPMVCKCQTLWSLDILHHCYVQYMSHFFGFKWRERLNYLLQAISLPLIQFPLFSVFLIQSNPVSIWVYPRKQIYSTITAISPTPTLHLARFMASSSKPTLLLSFSTCVFQVFFGRPCFLLPIISNSNSKCKLK